MPRGTLDEAHVFRQFPELAEAGEVRPAEVLGRVPGGVMSAGLRRGSELLARRRLRKQDLVAALHVRIDRLASDEEMLNLGGSFEDAIDAHIAQDPLDGIALLAAGTERLRGLEPASAANLQQLVRRVPRHFRVEQFGHRCFETEIDISTIVE